MELVPNIQVNGIYPGAIIWPKATQFSDENTNKALADVPIGNSGHPNDIANVALFLADQAHFITGEIILIDGGSSI